MSVFLSLYLPTLVAGALLAAALAGFGFHLVARGRSLESLVQAQGAALGTMLGLAIHTDHHDFEAALSMPVLLVAVGTGLAFALLARTLGRARPPGLPFMLVSLYLVLGACSQLLDAWLLKVDSHITQVYFGDLVTLGVRDAWIAGGLGAAALAFLALAHGGLERRSVEASLRLPRPLGRRERAVERGYDIGLLLLTAVSVQFLGILFTLAMVLIPGAILGSTRSPRFGPGRFLVTAAVGAATATVGAFLVSLGFTTLPTTPLVTLCLATVLVVFRLLLSRR